MKLSERRVEDQGIVVLELEGKFMLGESVSTTVDEHFEQGQKRILLDMGGLTYIDSSGVGDLVTCVLRASEVGGQVKLLRLPQRIHELFEIHHLLEVFDVFDDEEAAVSSFVS